jgi:hypothetical protein
MGKIELPVGFPLILNPDQFTQGRDLVHLGYGLEAEVKATRKVSLTLGGTAHMRA